MFGYFISVTESDSGLITDIYEFVSRTIEPANRRACIKNK